jgi:hypothetical protein
MDRQEIVALPQPERREQARDSKYMVEMRMSAAGDKSA